MSNMKIREQGSVRVDLLGGTIDLNPISLIIPEVVTLNLATSLKATVEIEHIDYDGVEFVSLDYETAKRYPSTDFTNEKLLGGHFGPMSFMAQILSLFEISSGLKIEMSSGSPPGAGLGGSSAMGITFYKALLKLTNLSESKKEIISKVNGIEGRIIDAGPAGYQDYYPAIFGGILALIPYPGAVSVDQLYNEKLKKFLESHITLIYSGKTRHSGINNWEVYKGFFDKKPEVRQGLNNIAKLSHRAYQAIKREEYFELLELIVKEGETREKLFPKIVTEEMSLLNHELKKIDPRFGIKVCGAGGGGCFLAIHHPETKESVRKIINSLNMRELEFRIESPLG